LEPPAVPFLFVGNDRCLDFLNTMIVDHGQPVDLIQSFDELARWLVDARLLELDTAAEMARQWRGTAEAADALMEARTLRTQLLTTVDGLIVGVSLSSEMIDALNVILQRRVGFEQIASDSPTRGQWSIKMRYAFLEPRDLLAPLAHAATVLLVTREPGRIKACESPTCVLHYYDTSKNGSRRWCDTRTCGNRIRVAHHYQRRHAH
jgi:predicted RNA-binding Zn ribbon-like protein